MISSLHIENIAVVKRLDVDLSGGMTVLSGETGAGKSIIIDSLGLLLGARADKDLIRSGEDTALVSAVFEELGDRAVERLSELGFDIEERSVMLSRSVSRSSSSAKLNGRGITLSLLKEIGGLLFNIHGQNDNQQILDSKNHIRILDGYAGNEALLGEYSGVYSEMLRVKREIESIDSDAMERNRLSEMLKFQISDIDSAKLKIGEEEKLEELVKKLRGAEKISKSCSLVAKAVMGGEKNMGAAYLVERAATALASVSDAIPEADELSSRLYAIKYELEDIADSTSALSDIGEGDPTERLDRAEARLDVIGKLKRKYGSSVEEILSFRDEAKRRLDNIENADDRREELKEELSAIISRARELCDSLHKRRLEAATGLTRGVTENLEFLDMPKVRFEVSVKKNSIFGRGGNDEVEFLIATNAGEPLAPMVKIASGGELARIMLSLKNVLNTSDGIDTVIFDEIDTGISGKISRKVGIKLKEIGKSSQVICVTHSAQIASLAHTHLYISKKNTEDGRVETEISMLDREGRVAEISRILGGIEVTDTQRSAAREMIAEGEAY
ncbi:MAG: DNA repair protein RecN [Clostridia bacterium]|nr:DNA repair protein RecN [Clostridia bacterium]